jgi:hypothetical protein
MRYTFRLSEFSSEISKVLVGIDDDLHYEFSVEDSKSVNEYALDHYSLIDKAFKCIRISFGEEDEELLVASRGNRDVHLLYRLEALALKSPRFRVIGNKLRDDFLSLCNYSEMDSSVVFELCDWVISGIYIRPPSGGQLPSAVGFDGDELEARKIVSAAFDPADETPDQRHSVRKQNEKIDKCLELMVMLVSKIVEGLLQGCRAMLDQYVSSLIFLSSQRAYPERDFSFSERRGANWKPSGGEAWEDLLTNRELLGKVNGWLQDSEHLKTPYRIKLREFIDYDAVKGIVLGFTNGDFEKFRAKLKSEEEKHDRELAEAGFDMADITESKSSRLDDAETYFSVNSMADKVERRKELCLEDITSGTLVSHREVGIGIAKLVPVLATAMGARNKTILIEEPESHLHPKAQTELADVFIDSALKSGANNSFIIETHSEHFILRVLRRIRECYENPEDYPKHLPKITPNDVSVIYMDPSKEGAKAHHLRISEDGDFLDKWPNGFFAERREELF